MGKWLAEFQENTPETHGSLTDKTDRSCDVSVMSVHDQGVLEEKLIKIASEACNGLDLTPEQFIRVMNDKAKKPIIEGQYSMERLKNLAKRLDESIKDGVVKLYVDMAEQEANRNITRI